MKIDDEIKTKFKDDKHRCITNLIYTSNWIQNQFSDYLKSYDLSNPQFNILRILRGSGDWAAMNEIKDLMVIKSPNTTRLSDKLLEKGLIERDRSEKDRRVVYLKITKAGLSLLKTMDEDTNVSHMDFTSKFTVEEAKTISAILDKLRS